MKKNIKEKIFIALKELITPLDGKPALVSALALSFTIAALDEPKFAVPLLGLVFLLTHFFRRHLQWVIFISMAAGIIVHEGIPWIDGPNARTVSERANYSMGSSQTVGKGRSISNAGCGKIESRLPRPKGTAFIVNVSRDA